MIGVEVELPDAFIYPRINLLEMPGTKPELLRPSESTPITLSVSQCSDIAKQRQANQTIAVINCISTCNQNKKCETKQANYPNEIRK